MPRCSGEHAHVALVFGVCCGVGLWLAGLYPSGWAVTAWRHGVNVYTIAVTSSAVDFPVPERGSAAVDATFHAGVIPFVVVLTTGVHSAHTAARARLWRQLNPDHTVLVYDDIACADFLEREYGEGVRRIFMRPRHGPIRADIFRVFYLHARGGVYGDLDTVPLAPIADIIPPPDGGPMLVVSQGRTPDKAMLIDPIFMAATPRHPTLQAAIDVYRGLAQRRMYTYWSWSVVHVLTALRDGGAPVQATLPWLCPIPHNRTYCFLQHGPEKHPLVRTRGDDYDRKRHAFRPAHAGPRAR